jgi:hypothetical protein
MAVLNVPVALNPAPLLVSPPSLSGFDGIGHTFVFMPPSFTSTACVLLTFVIHIIGLQILLVEIWQWVTYIFEDDLRWYAPKLKIMYSDGFNESWQSNSLEFGVDEITNALRKGGTIRAASKSIPV